MRVIRKADALASYQKNNKEPLEFKKTTAPPAKPSTAALKPFSTDYIKKSAKNFKGASKIAALLLLLDRDTAQPIIDKLPVESMEKVAAEMARLKDLTPRQMQTIAVDMGVLKKDTESVDGKDFVKSALKNAFGEKKAAELTHKAIPFDGEKPFVFLQELEYHQIKNLLKDESSLVKSLILAHIPPKKASLILKEASLKEQKEIVLRMARLQKVSPEVIVRIEAALKDRIRAQGRVTTQKIDGKDVLARIFQHMRSVDEATILNKLNNEEPELHQELENRIYKIELVLRMTAKGLQRLLRDFDTTRLALVWKAQPPEIQKSLSIGLSERRMQMLKEEIEFMGPVSKAEAAKATGELVDHLKKLEKSGQIAVAHQDELYV